MANTVRILRSTTAGAVPASLVSGQVAINEADGKLYYRSAAGVVTQFSAGGVSDPYDLGTYPLITVSAQPSSTTVVVGQSATFSVTAAATMPTATIAYQWQLSTDSGSTYSNVSGATSSSLSLTNLQTGSSGYRYRCRMTANLSQVYSSVATLTVNPSFTPTAVLLASGTTYTVPSGATTMKAWAVGAGYQNNSNTGAGGTAYKTWSVTGGSTVAYQCGSKNSTGGTATDAGRSSTVTYGGVTIFGYGGLNQTGGGFDGGDGGANGGGGRSHGGGAVGGNGTIASCGRAVMTDVSGLKAAVTLAGGKATEDCGATPAFGSGASGKYDPRLAAGYGGGAGDQNGLCPAANGAVILYFT